MQPPVMPGDVLLYSRNGFFSRLIRIKTWSRISHCEGAISPWRTVASRDGQGVNEYPISLDGLAYVLRPARRLDLQAAMAWFQTVQGQGYDWLGLLAFFAAKWQGKENGKMFCSEFLVRWLRAGGLEPFTPITDADAVAPGEFLKSPLFLVIWKEGEISEEAVG